MLSPNPATSPAKIPAEVVVGFSRSVFSAPTAPLAGRKSPKFSPLVNSAKNPVLALPITKRSPVEA